MIYCLFYRRFPAVRIFFVDHRSDIAVNIFGLVMSIVGDRFVWYLDPIGAILIALLILFSWVSNAFEHVWLLVGKSAPNEFISKLIYMAMTHDDRILKVDTVGFLSPSLCTLKFQTDRVDSAERTMPAKTIMSRSTLSWKRTCR